MANPPYPSLRKVCSGIVIIVAITITMHRDEADVKMLR